MGQLFKCLSEVPSHLLKMRRKHGQGQRTHLSNLKTIPDKILHLINSQISCYIPEIKEGQVHILVAP